MSNVIIVMIFIRSEARIYLSNLHFSQIKNDICMFRLHTIYWHHLALSGLPHFTNVTSCHQFTSDWCCTISTLRQNIVIAKAWRTRELIAVAKNGQIGYSDQSVHGLNCPKTVDKLLPSCHQAVGCHQPATKLDCYNKCSQVPRKKDPDLENSPALVTSIKSGQHWFVCKLLTRQGDND